MTECDTNLWITNGSFEKHIHTYVVLNQLVHFDWQSSFFLLMNMDQLAENELAGETKVVRQNVPQCHFAHQKSHMT
jgi:hypothetical protein